MTISYNRLLPVLLSYFVMGFVDIVGVSTGYAKKDFNLSPALAQLLPSMVFVWFFALSLPCSWLQSRHGKRRVLVAGTLLTAAGMFIPFIHYTYFTLLASFVLIGIGNTIIQVSSNPLLRDVTSAERFASFMSLSQFIKAMSSLLGPILVALAVTKWGDWKATLLLYGIISLLTGLWLSVIKIEEAVTKEPTTFLKSIKLLKHPLVSTIVLATFALVGIDVGLNTNIQYLLSTRFDVSLETASLGISVYFFSLMASRFVGAILLSKLDNQRFFVVSSFLTMMCMILVIISPSLELTLLFIGLTGLVSGNLFPLIFSLTVNKLPENANEISGLIIMSVVGGAIIPPLIGYVQNYFSAPISLIVLVICAFYIWVSSLNYKRLFESK